MRRTAVQTMNQRDTLQHLYDDILRQEKLRDATAEYRASVAALKQSRPRHRLTLAGRFWLGYFALVVIVGALAWIA